MKISISQKIIIFSITILAINGVLGYDVYKSKQKLFDSEKWVQHTEQVINQSANIRLITKDIQTASSSFIITNDSIFLEPLISAKKTAFVYIRQIRQLTRDNPVQQGRIDSLNFYIHRLLNFSFKTVEIRSKQGLATAIAYASTREGKYNTDRIRQIANAIQQDEGVLLKQRKQINARNETEFNRFSMFIIILMAWFTILLLIVAGKYLFQNNEKRKRAAELVIANQELWFQNEEKGKRAAELGVANDELSFQNEEKGKRAAELVVANKELLFQNNEKGKRAAELVIANKELSFQNEEKGKRAAELTIANKELLFQNEEKEKRAAELTIANKELLFQNEEKEKRAAELDVANDELLFQSEEKEKRAAELIVANKELLFQINEKGKRAAELVIANKELSFQNEEKGKRAAELDVANYELSFQSEEKEKRAAELIVANKELLFQNNEKGKRAAELVIANKELSFQNEEKGKRAAELDVANDELSFQSEEKEKRAAELVIANKELLFQNKEKGKRAAELVIANEELWFQNKEKEKRAIELTIANQELSFQNKEKEKRAAELTIANKELSFQNKEKEKRAAELKLAEIARIKMVNELLQRNNDLEQFAYIISHNLRAPVANIIGASSALNETGLSAEDKETLSRGINTSIIKLDEVVNDLNHILQVKSEIKEVKEIVCFSELIDDIRISILNLINKDDIEIKYDFSGINEFLTLKPYLYSIFFNLISNSVKYRRHDIHTLIEIKSSLVKNKIELIFTDNGLGIDLQKRGGQIFGLYKRFHTNIEGKGMGLFMVKTQVKILGGEISLKSEENNGTEFKIEFEI
ncbi:MAG: arcB 1 [Mucilaginibacter sp.]|nr:arcB 1 [Mucilaginibacter sp.]